MGEERPLGAATFHFRFFSGPNSSGGFCPSATPEPSGPRKRGQTRGSPATVTSEKKRRARQARSLFIGAPRIAWKWVDEPRQRQEQRCCKRAAVGPHDCAHSRNYMTGVSVDTNVLLFFGRRVMGSLCLGPVQERPAKHAAEVMGVVDADDDRVGAGG